MKLTQKFLRETGQVAAAPATSRALEEYRKFLGFRMKDLKGKRILDLGSGPFQTFAREVEDSLPNTEVYCLDRIFFEFPSFRNRGDRSIAGYFHDIPFADESFDAVLSCVAMPAYVEQQKHVRHCIYEALRVLRAGGKARFAPLNFFESNGNIASPDKTQSLLTSILRELDDVSFKIGNCMKNHRRISITKI